MSDLAEPPPLPLGPKLGFGLGAIAGGVAFVAFSGQVLFFYLNRVVGMPPLVVSSVILVSLIIDAVLDPLIGQWSDNLRTRWGRRHPFMYGAAFLWALTFFLLWNAPHTLSGYALLAFMVTLLVAVRLSASLYEIPSNALTPELAPHYDQRTGLIAYRFFFLVAGIAVMQQLLYKVFLKNNLLNGPGYATFGMVGGIVILIAALVSAMGTHQRIRYLHAPPPRRVGLALTLKEMLATLTHPALLVLMACSIVGGAAAGMRGALDNYFYAYLWELAPKDIANLGLAGAVGTIAAVLIAPVLAKRLGKKMTMICFFIASTATGLAPISLKLLGLMPPATSPWLFPILATDAVVAVGLGLSGLIIIASMVADVVEDNAVKTGQRSEGLLFAANGLVPKVTAGIGTMFAGILLTIVPLPHPGPHVAVPTEQIRHLTILFLPTYLVMVSLSIAVLIFYRLDRDTHERNLEKIREAAALASLSHAAETEMGSAP